MTYQSIQNGTLGQEKLVVLPYCDWFGHYLIFKRWWCHRCFEKLAEIWVGEIQKNFEF